jgi:hypothetical protein
MSVTAEHLRRVYIAIDEAAALSNRSRGMVSRVAEKQNKYNKPAVSEQHSPA